MRLNNDHLKFAQATTVIAGFPDQDEIAAGSSTELHWVFEVVEKKLCHFWQQDNLFYIAHTRVSVRAEPLSDTERLRNDRILQIVRLRGHIRGQDLPITSCVFSASAPLPKQEFDLRHLSAKCFLPCCAAQAAATGCTKLLILRQKIGYKSCVEMQIKLRLLRRHRKRLLELFLLFSTASVSTGCSDASELTPDPPTVPVVPL
ncbi:hypothetical protein DFH08DRAFT_819775 [Mycena albidolilacea]|uniref:Uncharacterized protein n=1 Tax=Mycena albidolilacea TaxID=1033008 RepID=A0AAD6ZEA3_9AGAR|nr:hypothetical protein DFH08DRAFT_819775 [Mycena albidolilacea]